MRGKRINDTSMLQISTPRNLHAAALLIVSWLGPEVLALRCRQFGRTEVFWILEHLVGAEQGEILCLLSPRLCICSGVINLGHEASCRRVVVFMLPERMEPRAVQRFLTRYPYGLQTALAFRGRPEPLIF
jgi:hypothetical protein